MEEKKTKQYTLNAINKYNSKFDRIMASFPTGTKDRITKLTGQSANKYITSVVLADLDRIESGAAPGPTVHKEIDTAAEQPAADQQEETSQDLRIRELGERIKENVRTLQGEQNED